MSNTRPRHGGLGQKPTSSEKETLPTMRPSETQSHVLDSLSNIAQASCIHKRMPNHLQNRSDARCGEIHKSAYSSGTDYELVNPPEVSLLAQYLILPWSNAVAACKRLVGGVFAPKFLESVVHRGARGASPPSIRIEGLGILIQEFTD